MSENVLELRSRRDLLKAGVVSVVALGVGGLVAGRHVRAEDLPKLEESDPQAQALKYLHDATMADAGVRGGEDRICETCRFYSGSEGAEWGPCSLFPGKAVNAKGWCAGWVATQT